MSAHARILTPTRLCILIAVLLAVFLYVCFDLLQSPEPAEYTDSDLAMEQPESAEPVTLELGTIEEEGGDFSGEGAGLSGAEATPSTGREKIAETGEAAFCIRGRIVVSGEKEIPEGLEVLAFEKRPPFAVFSISNADNQPSGYFHHYNWREDLKTCPRAKVDDSGGFIVKGVPDHPLYLTTNHPYYRSLHDRTYTPTPMKDIPGSPIEQEVELVLEPAGVIEGILRKPDDSEANKAIITLRGEVSPFFIFSGDKGIVASFVGEIKEKGTFRFEQVPVGFSLRLLAKIDGCAPLVLGSVRAKAYETVSLDLKLETPAEISGSVSLPSGEPAEGIELVLTNAKTSFNDAEKIAEEIKEQTDAEGKFCFEDLNEGTYKVTVMHPGYARDSVDGITVYSGDRVDHLEFVLDPGLCISGIVQDASGNRLAHAGIGVKKTFSLLAIKERLEEEMNPLSTATDEEGAFEIHGLKSGSYELNIRMEGYSPFKEEGIVAGTRDLVLTLQRGGIVRGIVLSSMTGEPVKQYVIKMEQTEGGSKSFMDQFGLENTVRYPIFDEKGKFAVTSLAPGGYEMSVKAEGFSTYTMKGISIGQGEVVEGLIIQLFDEASIAGTVMDVKTGDTIEGASIAMESGFMGMIKGYINKDVVYSDENGCFRLGGLSAGSVRLSVMHPKYEDTSLEEIKLLDSEDRTGVKVYLSKASTVHGHVWTARKKPIVGANIFVANMTGTRLKSDATDEDGYYEISGLPEGSYNVTKMPDTFSLGSDDFMESFMSSMQTRVIKVGKDEVVECDFIEEEAEASGTELTGIVRSAKEPQPGIFVQLHKVGSLEESALPKTTTTNNEGRYILKNVEPGEYTLLVTRTAETVGSYSMVFFDIDVRKRSPQEFDVDLPGACIAGRVRDKSRLTPLKNVRVTLYREGATHSNAFLSESMGMRQAEIYTDAEGRFRVTDLHSGTYNLRVGGENLLGLDSGGYAFRMLEDLRLRDDEQMDSLTIDLVQGGALEGRVLNLEGEPLSGASIHVRGPGQASFQEVSECLTDGSGFFRYPSLMPGSWTVQVKHADYATFTQSGIAIEEGSTASLNFNLTP